MLLQQLQHEGFPFQLQLELKLTKWDDNSWNDGNCDFQLSKWKPLLSLRDESKFSSLLLGKDLSIKIDTDYYDYAGSWIWAKFAKLAR